ncbi:hypothetical protein KSF78_0001668, partial [Schistosoma japonicum]
MHILQHGVAISGRWRTVLRKNKQQEEMRPLIMTKTGIPTRRRYAAEKDSVIYLFSKLMMTRVWLRFAENVFQQDNISR